MDYTDYMSILSFARARRVSHQYIYQLIKGARIDYITDYAGRKLIHKNANIKPSRLSTLALASTH